MAVIIPVAGRSSRFPNTRPKYLLTMHTGKLMLETAIEPYLKNHDIHIAILKEHNEKYFVANLINRMYKDRKNLHLHILDKETSGPAETVYMISKNLPDNEPLFIKDCDSFFTGEFRKDNHICVVDLRKNLDITKVAAKSFAVTNNQMMITNVVEKSVVSNYICVGGYGFSSAKEYNDAFKNIDCANEIFVSHVIKYMLENKNFVANEVTNYIDVGTYNEFVNYNQSKTTIFCDIDGTVFYNQSRLFENNYSQEPTPIPNSVKYLLQKQKGGCKIIFVTSRPKSFKDITEKKLNECGFKNYVVVYDLPHAPRTLINDYSTTNPYPTAISINVPRDNNDYWIDKR